MIIEETITCDISAAAVNTIPYIPCTTTCSPIYSLAQCDVPKPKRKQKENNMGCYDTDKSAAQLETEQRNHMRRRLDDVNYTKKNELREKFHMDAVIPYKTKDEVLAALKKGLVEFEDFYFDKDGHLKPGFNMHGVFSLVHPDRDAKGWEKARDALEKSYIKAKDAIIVAPLADGLKALHAFEATA